MDTGKAQRLRLLGMACGRLSNNSWMACPQLIPFRQTPGLVPQRAWHLPGTRRLKELSTAESRASTFSSRQGWNERAVLVPGLPFLLREAQQVSQSESCSLSSELVSVCHLNINSSHWGRGTIN